MSTFLFGLMNQRNNLTEGCVSSSGPQMIDFPVCADSSAKSVLRIFTNFFLESASNVSEACEHGVLDLRGEIVCDDQQQFFNASLKEAFRDLSFASDMFLAELKICTSDYVCPSGPGPGPEITRGNLTAGIFTVLFLLLCLCGGCYYYKQCLSELCRREAKVEGRAVVQPLLPPAAAAPVRPNRPVKSVRFSTLIGYGSLDDVADLEL